MSPNTSALTSSSSMPNVEGSSSQNTSGSDIGSASSEVVTTLWYIRLRVFSLEGTSRFGRIPVVLHTFHCANRACVNNICFFEQLAAISFNCKPSIYEYTNYTCTHESNVIKMVCSDSFAWFSILSYSLNSTLDLLTFHGFIF